MVTMSSQVQSPDSGREVTTQQMRYHDALLWMLISLLLDNIIPPALSTQRVISANSSNCIIMLIVPNIYNFR